MGSEESLMINEMEHIGNQRDVIMLWKATKEMINPMSSHMIGSVLLYG